MPHDYPRFWTELIQRVRGRATLYRHISPRTRSWLERTTAPGLTLNYFLPRNQVFALYIDCRAGAEAENIRLFESLMAGSRTSRRRHSTSPWWTR